MSAWIKKIILQNLTGASKNLGLATFSDLSRPHLPSGFHWQPFWSFEVQIEGMIESKKYLGKVDNLGLDLFSDPVRHFDAPWWPLWNLEAIGCSRQCGVPGGEHVPLPTLTGILFIFDISYYTRWIYKNSGQKPFKKQVIPTKCNSNEKIIFFYKQKDYLFMQGRSRLYPSLWPWQTPNLWHILLSKFVWK